MNRPGDAAQTHTLVLCHDAQFLGATRGVLEKIGGPHQIVRDVKHAFAALEAQKFDVVILDWREVEDPRPEVSSEASHPTDVADFLLAVRRSVLNHDCVLVAIVRDVLDVRQAFTAGVHFLIHKPASVVQIERCLHTAYLASVARRRKTYRAPVELRVVLTMRNVPAMHAVMLNLGEGGAALRISERGRISPASAGESLTVAFRLPGVSSVLQITGRVAWSTAAGDVGVQFTWMPESTRSELERWLTGSLENSVRELRQQLAEACA